MVLFVSSVLSVTKPFQVREQLLDGMLGADLIGFQTYGYMRHFLMTVTRLMGYECSPNGIRMEEKTVSVGIFPIGIDLSTINEKL